jgi:hypothetical protein
MFADNGFCTARRKRNVALGEKFEKSIADIRNEK